jgi:hypothetical protein
VPKPVGIVHVLVAAEPPERRLAKQSDHAVLAVLPGSRVHQMLPGQIGQPQGVVEFTDRQEPTVGSDLRAMEFQLQATVETDPQHPGFVCTHRVRHSIPSYPAITL